MSTIFSILTNSPGDLIYHLVVGFALILVMVFASIKVRHPLIGGRARHVLVGCGILLILQVILFSLTISVDPQRTASPLIYGLIERMVHALAVVWLIWTFNELGKRILSTSITGFISLALFLMCGISIGLTLLQAEFLQAVDEILLILWQSGTIILILSGMLLFLSQRPEQWGLAISMLTLLAMGYLLQHALGTPTVYMGAVRMAEIISFPWLLTLVYRFSEKKVKEEKYEIRPEPSSKRPSANIKSDLINHLLKISLMETSDEKFNAVARALSLSVISDICYLIQLTDENQKVLVLAGYDLIREEELQKAVLKHDQLPRIMEAWGENQSLDLSYTSPDVQDAATFTSLLRYHRMGNLFAYPLQTDQTNHGGVVFLSPYTNKHQGNETRQLMDEIKETLTQVLFSQDPKKMLHNEINELVNNINTLKDQKRKIETALVEKETQITELHTLNKQLKAEYQKDKLQSVKQIDSLKENIQELIGKRPSQDEQLKQLEQANQRQRQLIDERDQLKAALSNANARIKELESQTGQTGPIRLSIDSQIISLDSIAANIRLQVNPLLQHNNLNLEIVNPDGRQMVKVDPGLVQAVLNGLLENAILASEQDEKIQINQKVSYETGMLILQVTDFGDGLTPDEQKDLFSADHDSIPGIGSVQSIRKAIQAIRVLNGKIWLRSKKGSFTTFRVQLPIRIID